MTDDGTHWLSRISPHPSLRVDQLVRLNGLDPYRQHQALCKLYQLPPKEEKPLLARTPFLFRAERIEPNSVLAVENRNLAGLPVFYVLSKERPNDPTGLWRIETNDDGYRPDLREGDRLRFRLRANPVTLTKAERPVEQREGWLRDRKNKGLRDKELTRKRIRHDVVIAAKQKLDWKNLPEPERPSLDQLAFQAGKEWLIGQQRRLGFELLEDVRHPSGLDQAEPVLRIHSYSTWRQNRRKRRDKITLSTLDFEGVLAVTDPALFVEEALFNGIGPAKAFGCGLMLVRRA